MLVKIKRPYPTQFEVHVDGKYVAFFTRNPYAAGYHLYDVTGRRIECIGASAPIRYMRKHDNKWYYYAPRQCDMELSFKAAWRAGAVPDETAIKIRTEYEKHVD